MHLLIDGFEGSLALTENEQSVFNFLDSFPAEIGMNKISIPQVTTYHGPVEEDWGVSGFVMIAESHISVHTFPKRAYVNIDVFSCKDFDHKQTLSKVINFFSLKHVKYWLIGRGLDYSKKPSGSSSVRGRASSTTRNSDS